MKEVKVGIVGCGGIAGGKHLPGHKGSKVFRLSQHAILTKHAQKRSPNNTTFRTFSVIMKN